MVNNSPPYPSLGSPFRLVFLSSRRRRHITREKQINSGRLTKFYEFGLMVGLLSNSFSNYKVLHDIDCTDQNKHTSICVFLFLTCGCKSRASRPSASCRTTLPRSFRLYTNFTKESKTIGIDRLDLPVIQNSSLSKAPPLLLAISIWKRNISYFGSRVEIPLFRKVKKLVLNLKSSQLLSFDHLKNVRITSRDSSLALDRRLSFPSSWFGFSRIFTCVYDGFNFYSDLEATNDRLNLSLSRSIINQYETNSSKLHDNQDRKFSKPLDFHGNEFELNFKKDKFCRYDDIDFAIQTTPVIEPSQKSYISRENKETEISVLAVSVSETVQNNRENNKISEIIDHKSELNQKNRHVKLKHYDGSGINKNQEIPIVPGEPRQKKKKTQLIEDMWRYQTLKNENPEWFSRYNHFRRSTRVKHKSMDWWCGTSFEYDHIYRTILPSINYRFS